MVMLDWADKSKSRATTKPASPPVIQPEGHENLRHSQSSSFSWHFRCGTNGPLFPCRWGLARASVQFSRSVMSDSLRPHELQHTRPPCPSPTPRVHPSPCSLSQWCNPTISSFVITFSSCLQSFPASGSFQMSQLFTSGGQSIGVSASASVLPMNIQDWFPLGLKEQYLYLI